jgi:hypothetical protein
VSREQKEGGRERKEGKEELFPLRPSGRGDRTLRELHEVSDRRRLFRSRRGRGEEGKRVCSLRGRERRKGEEREGLRARKRAMLLIEVELLHCFPFYKTGTERAGSAMLD